MCIRDSLQIAHGNLVGAEAEFAGLLDGPVRVGSAGGDADHVELVSMFADDINRLRTDRTCRAQDDYILHAPIVP